MLTKPDVILTNFIKVAQLSGMRLGGDHVYHQSLPAPHQPPALPRNHYAVYVFSLAAESNLILKVGMVGPKSNPRFRSQHYNPRSAPSNLAKSILENPFAFENYGLPSPSEGNIKTWLMGNTDRDHFFISPTEEAKYCAKLLEVYLQTLLRPFYEG